MQQAIAIVGMACRFPDASHPDQFWQNILARKTSFREIDPSRWNHALFHSSKRRTPNSTYSQTAALLKDIDSFAATKFQISPRRARHMDPQQRLLLEVAREALQDGGFETRAWNREETAVFVGVNLSEYGNLMSTSVRGRQIADGQFGVAGGLEDKALEDFTTANAYTLPGSNISMCASCLSQTFDCGGPAIAVDAACASSMAATVQGVQYLRTLPESDGPAPLVMVGGAYLMLTPDNSICFSKIGALAERECRPFDHRAEGFILGEGAAVILLKRLHEAERDGDKIYGLIRGVAWNNQGRSPSPTIPLQPGQTRVMQAGLKDAAFSASSVGYIECHGTGTSVGDPVELASLDEVFSGEKSKPQLGSVKANIGHTLGASGLAGILRATLALHHKTRPPQAGFETWNPKLQNHASQFEIPTAPNEWPKGPRRAVVSSFAFGGTNCFLALEEAPPSKTQAPESSGPFLFRFSASNWLLLSQYLSELRPYLENPQYSLEALSQVLSSREKDETFALILADSQRDLVQAVDRLLDYLLCPEGNWRLVTEQALCGTSSEELPESYPSRWADLLPSSEEGPDVLPRLSLPFAPLPRQKYWYTKSPLNEPGVPRQEAALQDFGVFSQLRETLNSPELGLHSPLPSQAFELFPQLQDAKGVPTLLDLAHHCSQTLEAKAVQRLELTLQNNSQLLDHALQGRPVLPLACALELMTRGLEFPLHLQNIQVKRGVLLSQNTTVEITREGHQLELWEIRPTGRRVLAFRAEISEDSKPPSPQLQTPLVPASLSLEEFYKEHTFHGPSFQGILNVFGSSQNRLSARVMPSCAHRWGHSKAIWRLDPLVVDSAFQLAIYWSLMETGKGLLPESIEHFTLLKPFSLSSAFVELSLRSVDSEGAIGDYRFLCQGETRAWMSGVKGRFVDPNSLKKRELRPDLQACL